MSVKPLLFGKYCLLERVSVGGMAEVFRAKPFDVPDFKGYLALKRILPHLAEDDEFINMFVDEAKLTVQLNHPNIVRIYELGQFQSSSYILMEFISGKDILALQKTMRKRRDVIGIGMSLFIAREIGRGLHYAHYARDAAGNPLNIIHRDVSPQNVLIDYRGGVKVIDFGIAKAAVQSTRTQVGVLKGKMGYMSPEQVRGEVLDYRSDVFAIGTVLWEMLTNRRLFHAENEFETMQKVREADVAPPSSRVPTIPPDIDALVMRALTKDPEHRYESAGAFADAIDVALQSFPFEREDLSVWMRTVYADDLEEERTKREQFAEIRTPDDVRRLVLQNFSTPKSEGADTDEREKVQAGEGSTSRDTLEQVNNTDIWAAQIAPSEGEDLNEFVNQHTVVQAGGFDAALIELDDLDTAEKPKLTDASDDDAPPSIHFIDDEPTPVDVGPPPEHFDVSDTRADGGFQDVATSPGLRRPPREGIPGALKVVAAASLLLFFAGVASVVALLVSDVDEPPPPTTGALVINVSPPTELEILVDGKVVAAESPFKIEKADPGPRLIEVHRAGSVSYRAKVDVVAGGLTPLEVVLEPVPNPQGVVVLRLPAENDDLTVWVDGEKREVSPSKTPSFTVSAGEHLFEVTSPGFRPWSASVEVKDSVRKEEIVRLVPVRGSFTVEAGELAQVTFDRKSVGRGTVTIADVDPSELHDLRVVVRSQGTSIWRGALGQPQVATGKITVDFDKPLPPQRKAREFGELAIDTGPSWWEVELDGVPTGLATPIVADDAIPVLRGTHKLTLRRGATTRAFDIEIVGGERLEFQEELPFRFEPTGGG